MAGVDLEFTACRLWPHQRLRFRAAGMAAAENEHPVGIQVATAQGYTRPPPGRFLHDPLC